MKARLGVSACLLGEEVRFDGGHKRQPFLADTLTPFVEWVRVCPEDEAGFGTPREPMQLVMSISGARLVTVESRRDVTEQLEHYSRTRVPAVAALDLDGYVFKKNSPSCGWQDVQFHDTAGSVAGAGRGLFAARLAEALPRLPVEEEGRLEDPQLREHFLVRVFAHRRLRQQLPESVHVTGLVAFHARHKMLLLAHSPSHYRDLGRLVASTRPQGMPQATAEYQRIFLDALARPASRGGHTNVLQHLAGYFDELLDGESRRALTTLIADYQAGRLPRSAPVAAIARHAERHGVRYLLDQVYLEPYPAALYV